LTLRMRVGILLFNEVEVLDFAGPFEVFSLAEYPDTKEKAFQVVTISEKDEVLSARNGLKVKADFRFDNHPSLDLFIVPGGYGAEKIEIENPVALAWIKSTAAKTPLVASVCTGAFLLAKAGVLTDEEVTTHHLDQADLQRQYPNLKVLAGRKYVDVGKIVTSGGISAGIEMSFHLVARLAGTEIAGNTARRMEYDWKDFPA
jgi:transcriptional regulator GlxA family with amidase domain